MSPVWSRSSVVRLQDGLVRLLGNSVEGRSPLVAAMLRRDAREATSYWLQLVVSIGIATLGLVVGSTAVVIGAMLVAPLMGPIVGLAMGLATGSPFLVLRSAGRIGLSVLVAVGGAALITLMLPFHELNAEIAARTSPTVLDLITAGFCALAGVYASLRPGSDTATTAAGTSISISLVPPLCASGYGLGTATGLVAGGAALLFLTNLVAIVVVGTMSFLAAGFNRVDVVSLEHEELEKGGGEAPIARAVARRLSTLFESRWGTALRFLMPFVLLAAVYVPLRRALDEMAWEVRVRAAVSQSVAREPLRVLQSRARVERHKVDLVAVILGKAKDAEAARERLDAEIRQASGVTPHLEIFAVPDANAIAGLESSLLTPQAATAMPIAPPLPSPNEQLDAARDRVRSVVLGLWPEAAAGKVVAVDIGTGDVGPLHLRVVHLGAPLSQDGAEALRRSIESALGRETRLVDAAVPAMELDRAGGDLSFVARVSAGIRAAAGAPEVSVCVTRPEERVRRATARANAELALALDEVLASHPRVTAVAGGEWNVRFVAGSCAPPPTAGRASPHRGRTTARERALSPDGSSAERALARPALPR